MLMAADLTGEYGAPDIKHRSLSSRPPGVWVIGCRLNPRGTRSGIRGRQKAPGRTQHNICCMSTGTEGLPEFGHVGDEVNPAVTDPRVLQAMFLLSGTGGVGEPETRAGSHGPGDGKDSVCDWEPTGRNMPAIPRRVAEKIRRGQYVDFSSLPPASGLAKHRGGSRNFDRGVLF